MTEKPKYNCYDCENYYYCKKLEEEGALPESRLSFLKKQPCEELVVPFPRDEND